MRVVDASVVTDALVVEGAAGVAARAVLSGQTMLVAPVVLPAEVVSALRGLVRRGQVHPVRARAAVRRLVAMRSSLHHFAPFAGRCWELRDNVTVYDAWYVALAERLDVPLVTADSRLATAPGLLCEVVLLRPSG